MSPNAVAQFDSLREKSAFIFAVFYRGDWCPFCMAYLKTLNGLIPTIAASGGSVVIISAQTSDHLEAVRTKSGFTGDAISDPENLLAAELKKRNLLNVAITEREGYATGVTQPAILVLQRDGTALESWAIIPSEMNLGGAKDRPVLDQVWENVQARLKGQQAVHSSFQNDRQLDDILAQILAKK
ncbi:hypothetical protein BGZ63DRAFT_509447 [Mariannaea sp. PMI_226]|nr:hypothetical protein BGZ63DRAFT_509447 [Mariannaea sp. PMI_226]